MATLNFDNSFKVLTGHPCFPWQRRLFESLRKGDLPSAVDIPTGLGKTAVMALWLLARTENVSLPRRLVYVVDRRAVVDQATRFAEDIRENLSAESLTEVRQRLGLADRPLPISTLRGKYVDNREWLDNPSLPAIIVGTVDMVGSRLLFEGYGVSRRMRPYQAGLMGCDSLVLLDEAHLAGPFERLLKTVALERSAQPSARGCFAGLSPEADLVPAFAVLPLSATLASASSEDAFSLDGEDRKHPVVKQRINAKKRITVVDLKSQSAKQGELVDALTGRAWAFANSATGSGSSPARTLVYCDQRTVAEKVAAALRSKANKDKTTTPKVILFVGGRRVHEREKAAEELQRYGMIAGAKRSAVPVLVVATSAGEVGVDLDADHMVCDLVAWERMVQRLGRVNRRGETSAEVVVIDHESDQELSKTDKAKPEVMRRHELLQAVRTILQALPDANASPKAIMGIGGRIPPEQVKTASSPMPLYPALTRPLVDAWAMTSLKEHTGRPEVGPWLRGWVDDDEPQTTVVWRRWLPVHVESGQIVSTSDKEIEAFFEAAPPQMAELLETETRAVVEWLKARATKIAKGKVAAEQADADDSDRVAAPIRELDAALSPQTPNMPVAYCLDRDGSVAAKLSLKDLSNTKDVWGKIAGNTVILNSRFGGLEEGLLNKDCSTPASTIDDDFGDRAIDATSDPASSSRHQLAFELQAQESAEVDTEAPPAVRIRPLTDEQRNPIVVRGKTPDCGERQWLETLAMPCKVSPEGEALIWLVVEKSLHATNEESRSLSLNEQGLDEHQQWVADAAADIADSLNVPGPLRQVLVTAARHHDEGKRAPRWQRAFSAPAEGAPYAKTKGPFRRHVLNGFRHEFQSVIDLESKDLPGLGDTDHRELVLHLVAAHHGQARPVIGVDGCESLPPTAAAQHGHAIALRFARLQKHWGPWGLAWWEALLRAADQRASRALESGETLARRTA